MKQPPVAAGCAAMRIGGRTILLLATAGVMTLPGCATDRNSTAGSGMRRRPKVTPYPFETCAVIRRSLEGRRVLRRVHEGQEVLFCCRPCVRAFEANPEPFMARIRAGVAGQDVELTTLPATETGAIAAAAMSVEER